MKRWYWHNFRLLLNVYYNGQFLLTELNFTTLFRNTPPAKPSKRYYFTWKQGFAFGGGGKSLLLLNMWLYSDIHSVLTIQLLIMLVLVVYYRNHCVAGFQVSLISYGVFVFMLSLTCHIAIVFDVWQVTNCPRRAIAEASRLLFTGRF